MQGPALLAWNDAQFSEADWKGIRSMHESVKREDPLKVGRFGLGFKSVYHMTGLPYYSNVSSQTLGVSIVAQAEVSMYCTEQIDNLPSTK